MSCLGYESVAVAGTAKDASDLTIPAGTTIAEIQAQDVGKIHYTLDGDTTPTTTVGMSLPAGGFIQEVRIEDLLNIQFIDESTDTRLNIQYFGRAV